MKKSSKKRACLLRKNEKGIVLLATYFLVTVISIMALAIFSRGTSFLQTTERNQNRIVAFNMAEAGLDNAVAQLTADATFTGNAYTSLSTNAVRGGYQTTVTTPALNANVRLIQSTGHSPSNDATQRAYEQRSVLAYAEIDEESYFDFAVFAKQGMQINGNPLIDSYDSRNGSYGSQTPGDNGDIGTNSTGNSTVTLNGNADVRGDAQVGPNANPADVISMTGNSSLSGAQTSMTKEKQYPSVTTGLASQGQLRLNGNSNLTLAGGTYHYSSLSISGNASLNLSGPTIIYVSGEVSITGNGIGTSADSPPNLLIYVTTNNDVKIAGNGDFYGGIYAPDSNVKVTGNGSVYGAIVSNSYQQSGNGDLHFDEALVDTGKTGQGDISIVSWTEVNTAAGI